MKLINTLILATFIVSSIACNSSSNSAESVEHTPQVETVDSIAETLVETSTEEIADLTDTVSECVIEELSLDDIIKNLQPIKYPQNIRAYVDEVIADGKHLICSHLEDKDKQIKAIQNLADNLQGYKNGTKRYFPKEELDNVLDFLINSIGYVESHAGYLNADDVKIFPRLLELAANICPDINLMATHTSTDKNMGVINIYPQYIGGYDFTAIIAKNNRGGFNINYLPQYQTQITRIRLIDNTNNPKQYLLSQEYNDNLFSVIYIADYNPNGNIKIHELSYDFNWEEWTSVKSSSHNMATTDKKLYFNTKELSWSWCYTKENGYLEKIPGSKTLCIDLKSYKLILK